MKLPAAIERAAASFDRISMRERVMISAALFAAVIMIWMMGFLDPLTAKQRALRSEVSTLQESILAAAQTLESDATTAALTQEQQLRAELEEINGKLESKSAGLIPPNRMVQFIHDVLSRQRGITLVSLRNLPVTSLVQEAPAAAREPSSENVGSAEGEESSAETAQSQHAAPSDSAGPYMHPAELVIEGRYLDILAYLRALEELPWHFYWKVLELQTTEYPINRVRIEMGTLSMDKEWLGV